MEVSDGELFESALSNEQPEVTVEQTTTEGEGVARDEQGRFAKSETVEPPKAEVEQAKPVETKEEAQVPSWRLRELRERAEAAETRARTIEQQLLALQPKPEPQAKPDIFEKPDEFVRSNVQEAISPLEKQFSEYREAMSQRMAIKDHGEETVTEAFKTLDQAAKAGDPQAVAVVQAVKKSMDPYGDIVSWYRGNEASRNPDGFFQRRLEEALKDEKFKGELMAKLQPAAEEKPKPVFNIPPSLARTASAASALQDGGDLSNESLFAAAMR
jgi:hypothetical protein